MAGEVDQVGGGAGVAPGEQGLSGAELRISELEGLLAQREEELAQVRARVGELEQAVAAKDSELAALGESRAELEERLSSVNQALSDAVASYKAMVVQANPEVMEELITGDTIEAINQSLERAKSLIGRVRQGLEAELSRARVPTGAPERRVPDLSALSPREKIQYAIGGRR